MKILGIWGSPRVGGNSEVLLDAFLQGAQEGGGEIEKVALRSLKISPCLEIYKCFKDGDCPIKDDMQELYPKLLSADVVALASPIFFYGLTAQAKAMIDRTQAFWARRYVLKQEFPGENRQGVLLATAATKGKHVFVGARLVTHYFFDAINIRYAAEVLVKQVDEKGAIRKRPEVLAEARELGRRFGQGEQFGKVKVFPVV
ncbi:flavodoxin family protein [Desulfobacca acetoxidans]|uniref:NADPH-dependent FMN reductase n=1 Tax=Desulfobacca acetoxidans (strain ATCC 700848 / DSM 11109 / ASRB2) TaxID=880072 RepID=F2NH43_DESAR|nr:flavodoxin family protein [Desulfobacca acetoxidans]AEB08814.1 NADPH-dependent FMN reductase [Desulfobacca acetoxidans DSM 11109]HAY22758.1 flavodoxin family protein [Desulfobacterales bacterium]